ncbi:co-chaperone YbbN [Lentzea sp. CC55]|uniref:thioredoxin family protein n=1 Tax=Lentzea sp. CC55 TaxID=2884909 RepID=UPI001F2C8FC9|nr:thioredoxin family protein [Lentzea sp. CC55]MCG8927376.1 thioredoxin family protein [Lentzea sp. CC55]
MAAQGTDATFEQEIELSPVPVVVEFYATWCGNCRRIESVLDDLEAEFAPNVRLVKVNADENAQLVSKFAVTSTPTLFAIVSGAQVATTIGAQPEPVLRAVFEAAATRVATEPGEGCGCGPSCSSATGEPAIGWVDARACTLPTDDQPMRLAEFEALFASSLREVRREESGWLRLRLGGGADVEAGARDLARRESDCCSFFDFAVGRDGDEVIVDVRVPSDKEAVLDGLAAQAEAARTEGEQW